MKYSSPGIIAGTGIVILIVILLALLIMQNDNSDEYLYFEVQRGDIETLVLVTGELESEISTAIRGPSALQSRNIRLGSVIIQDLIAEGTIVEKGDWVATLDRTEATISLSELQEQMMTEESRYNSAILDTTISMSTLRDELINLEYSLEEFNLVLEQSVYEPPATIRQAEINLERAIQNLDLARENFKLHQQDAIEKVREAELEFDRRKRRYQALRDVIEQFDITAPGSGMVIYHREWNGSKRSVGSRIHSRDLTVAVIPDLTSLISRTYVSEIDIDQIVTGLPVRIGVDAFPEREYEGRVMEVSNVGQDMPGTETKVFEVSILIDRIDSFLRPAMTTSNAIITGQFRDVYYVPLAAVHEPNGTPYVYKNDGTRQIVSTGAFNHNYIIIESGLEEGDLVHLEIPENSESYKLVGNEPVAMNLSVN
jgi:HlyD family secretion protein